MIETTCMCGASLRAAEAQANQQTRCAQCGATTVFVAAEQLADGAGAADFDTALVLPFAAEDGSVQTWQFFLGGVAEIQIGKLAEKHIVLGGPKVSRSHCRLGRLDFGPSRWKVIDNRSTNGTIVNDERIAERELHHGDLLNVGDNVMSFREIAPQSIPEPVRSPSQTPSSRGASADARGDGVPCPSCGKRYAKTAKICVACGVDIRTGRPLITSQALDENVLYANAESTISIISWVIPFGLYPIASEAFGGRKPIVIWSIAILTVLISIWFFFAAGIYASDRGDGAPSVAGLMLWSGHPMNAADLERELQNVPGVNGSLRKEEIKKIAESAVDDSPEQFHFYQLITHAFLHGGIMHLAGNMLFLLVFGTRVNAFIGNVATAIVYPILAIGAGACHFIAMRSGTLHPMLGASGAIMGLAGMYFVLFPVHRVFMAIWLRMGLFTGFRLSMNVWPLRGFWVVLFYIAFDVVFTAFGIKDGTAHWAHLGGFGFGMLIALILLLTRLVDAHRADLISVTLGKGAWRFLGRPGEAMPARAA